MIVRTRVDIEGSDHDARGECWRSRRFLTAADKVGFSLTETAVNAGADMVLWYKNHIEANYVIDGEGEVEDMTTGEVYPLAAGSTYTLDKHDRHRLRAITDLRLICVFTPALRGDETHDADGSYLITAS